MPTHTAAARARTCLPLLLLTAGGVAAAAGPKVPIPRGRVTYQVKHPMLGGTSTLVWAEGGKKFRQDSNLKFTMPPSAGTGGAPPAAPQQVSSWIIGDGTWVYAHSSMMGRTVQRMKPGAGAAPGGPGAVPFTMDRESFGKVVGRATMLGKNCEIRQKDGVKVWLWESLPLRLEAAAPAGASGPQAMAGGLSMLATRLESDYAAPASLFKVPAGMTVVDAGAGRPGGAAPPAGRPR
jgi:hypothetical protein